MLHNSDTRLHSQISGELELVGEKKNLAYRSRGETSMADAISSAYTGNSSKREVYRIEIAHSVFSNNAADETTLDTGSGAR